MCSQLQIILHVWFRSTVNRRFATYLGIYRSTIRAGKNRNASIGMMVYRRY